MSIFPTRTEVVVSNAKSRDARLCGQGSWHRAGLNFGDLFRYALAKVRGLPLPYQSEDFARTDMAQVVASR